MAVDYTDKKERFRLAREIAEEGIILLKNENDFLPLGQETVAVFGRTQVDTIKCGTGSAFCESEYTADILSGMEREGISVDATLASRYRAFAAENPISAFGVWGSGSHLQPEMPISEETVRAASFRAEKAIIVIGRTAGENDDISPIAGDYLLSSEEEQLLTLVCRHFSRVCVVINSGNLIDFSFVDRPEVEALLLLSLPGMEGGNALAGVLSGRVNPSGKLTDTIAYEYRDYPASAAFGKRSGLIQKYTEDIYVGYRYFETFAPERVRYPFGFGLSYTSFETECVSFSVEDGTVRAVLDVTNTGAHKGKEVVMLYSTSPREKLGAPALELRTFVKTELLAPGETERVTLSFAVSEMASFDDVGVIERDAWVMEKGTFRIAFGNNIKTLRPAGCYENPADVILKRCVHLPTRLEERLSADGAVESLEHLPPDVSAGIPVPPLGTCCISAEAAVCGEDRTASFRLCVSAAGVYRLGFACAAGGRFSDCYSLALGGAPISEFDCVMDGKDSGDIILAPGTVTLTLTAKTENPPCIGTLILEKNNAPITIGEGVSLVEGGKYTECALYVVTCPFSDDGAMKSGRALARMHTPGRYALYHLNVKKAGYYDVRLRYENPHGGMALDETFAFLISNVGQALPPVTLSHTADAGEHRFATSEPMRFAFPAGECWFKIVSVTTTPPVIAYFEFSPAAEGALAPVQRSSAQAAAESVHPAKEYCRRPLSARGNAPDFRDVMAGKLSVEAFADSLSDEELAALTCGNAEGQVGYLPSRGVPEAYWADGPVGLRLEAKTTAYPSGTMVASTWNTALAGELGRAIGYEAHEYHVDMWLAPGVNLHRDPCCGRSFEYNSEDPLLSGRIAAAIIRGVQEQHVAATIKHFAANSTEYQRLRSDSFISARALRELYMKAFEIAIREASPWAVMTSYNHINGEKVPESYVICTDVMRAELGFDGVLVTDWGNDSLHVKELAAGHDLKMSFGDAKSVLAALADGTLSRARVRESAVRVLKLILRTAGACSAGKSGE